MLSWPSKINTNRYEQQEFAISIDLGLHFQPTHMHRTQQIIISSVSSYQQHHPGHLSVCINIKGRSITTAVASWATNHCRAFTMAVSELSAEGSSKKAGKINHVNINWIGASYQLSMGHMTVRSISITPAYQTGIKDIYKSKPIQPAKTESCRLLCSSAPQAT